MNYSVIKKYDTSNGLGIRTSIFFTGCNFHCQGCFNKELWDFKSGKPFDEEAKTLLFEYLGDKHVKGLSVLGGEPLQQNFTELKDLLLSVKEKYPERIFGCGQDIILTNLVQSKRRLLDALIGLWTEGLRLTKRLARQVIAVRKIRLYGK